MRRIMIIRHAEKPHELGPERGVTLDGHHDKHELTVRGWQRAGALVPFFVPARGHAEGAPISTPRVIMASAATPHSPSLRSQNTVTPLADRLGLTIDARHAEGEENDVAMSALGASGHGPVLISWHHHQIVVLAGLIAGDFEICPPHWPDGRFDMVWVLDQLGERWPWRFHQVPQCLLAGDRATTL